MEEGTKAFTLEVEAHQEGDGDGEVENEMCGVRGDGKVFVAVSCACVVVSAFFENSNRSTVL